MPTFVCVTTGKWFRQCIIGDWSSSGLQSLQDNFSKSSLVMTTFSLEAKSSPQSFIVDKISDNSSIRYWTNLSNWKTFWSSANCFNGCSLCSLLTKALVTLFWHKMSGFFLTALKTIPKSISLALLSLVPSGMDPPVLNLGSKAWIMLPFLDWNWLCIQFRQWIKSWIALHSNRRLKNK